MSNQGDPPDLPPEPASGVAGAGRAAAVGRGADRMLRPTMRGVAIGVRLASVPIIATGVVAVVGSVLAWRSLPLALVLGAGAGLVTIGTTVFVVRRIARLAKAVGEPTVVVDQARDLASQARASGPELTDLARQARSLPLPQPGQGRVRGAWGLARLVSTALSMAQPDAKRHDRLAPLTPAQIKTTWLATLTALWTWAVSAVVVIAAVVYGFLTLLAG